MNNMYFRVLTLKGQDVGPWGLSGQVHRAQNSHLDMEILYKFMRRDSAMLDKDTSHLLVRAFPSGGSGHF